MGRHVIGFALLAVAVGTAACGDAGSTREGTPPAPTDDAGAGEQDAGDMVPPAPPAAGIPAGDGIATDPEPGLFAEEADDVGARAGGFTCFDGIDNDADGVVDCDEVECGAYYSCSVGHGDRCLDSGGGVIDIASCNGLPVGECLGASEFGTNWVAAQMLHPGGDAEQLAGVELPAEYDLTSERLTVSAEFGDATCTGCVESATLALTAERDIAVGDPVRPLVALQLGASRNEMSLVVNEEIVQRWDIDEGSVTEWGLVLKPTGSVVVTRRGGAVGTFAFLPAAGARVVVYGRNSNRPADDPNGARIGNISITTQQCDMPDSWTTRDPISIRILTSAPYSPDAPTVAPSLAHHDGQTAIAFEEDGAIHFGMRGAATTDLVLDTRVGSPALFADQFAYQNAAVRDPELYYDTDADAWAMLFTAVDAAGTRSIGRALRYTDTEPHRFDPDENPLIDPADVPGVDHLEMPTITRTGAGIWVVVARAILSGSGAHELVAFHSIDTKAWTQFTGGTLESLTHRGDGEHSGFDADEIRSPSLIIHNGAYHLYYEGRRGARSAIGLLASDQLLLWHDVSRDGPIFAGSGSGFDRLSVRDADVAVDRGLVEMMYVGVEMGADARLGRTARWVARP